MRLDKDIKKHIDALSDLLSKHEQTFENELLKIKDKALAGKIKRDLKDAKEGKKTFEDVMKTINQIKQ